MSPHLLSAFDRPMKLNRITEEVRLETRIDSIRPKEKNELEEGKKKSKSKSKEKSSTSNSSLTGMIFGFEFRVPSGIHILNFLHIHMCIHCARRKCRLESVFLICDYER